MDANKFFTKISLANHLDVSTRTLDRWHARRIGPPRSKIGHFIAYRMDAVEEWLRDNETSPVMGGKND